MSESPSGLATTDDAQSESSESPAAKAVFNGHLQGQKLCLRHFETLGTNIPGFNTWVAALGRAGGEVPEDRVRFHGEGMHGGDGRGPEQEPLAAGGLAPVCLHPPR